MNENLECENHQDQNLQPKIKENKSKLAEYFNKNGNERLMQQFEVIHNDYKIFENIYTSIYILLDMNRYLIINLFVVFFSEYPYEQMIVLSIANFIIVVYTVIFRPFKSLKIFSINFVNETVVFIIYFCTCYLSYLDEVEDFDYPRRLMIGQVILYLNIGLNYFFSALFFIDLALLTVGLTTKIFLKIKKLKIKVPK